MQFLLCMKDIPLLPATFKPFKAKTFYICRIKKFGYQVDFRGFSVVNGARRISKPA